MGTIANVAILPADSNELRIEEVELPDPGPNQVIVQQFASGICHSQLHNIHARRNHALLLGHESTGVVTKTGSEVAHVREGDIVVITWVPRHAAGENRQPDGIELQVSDGVARSDCVFTWADVTIADSQFVVKVDPAIPGSCSLVSVSR